ncbi:TPA: hypothetical protein MHW22_27700, partial [Klebsiella pneumoniae]|nr:hypothetical protein [Klebsiella pneumoniae]
QCDFRRDGTHYVWEVNKAHDILRFWYLLALRGHTGLATTRVEADYKGVRLENGNYPTLRLFFVQRGIDCT